MGNGVLCYDSPLFASLFKTKRIPHMNPSTGSALSIDNAHKTYRNGFTALKGVSFDVKQGEFFGLLGPNGAGKTTLISAMAGLSKLSQGNINIMGYDTRKHPNQCRMSLGVVPQELVYDPFFNVREALQFQSGYFGIRKNEAWIDELLVKLNLDDKADTNTRNLSGGMKRRLMVAQALVHRPPVIVLDEPTAGVDVELRQSLWQFVEELHQQGHTIILTTHYLEEAQTLCNRIAMMKHGELVALDSTANLLKSGQGVRVSLLLSAALPLVLQKWQMPSDGENTILQLDDYAQLAYVLSTLQYEHVEVKNLAVLENDLEQVFLQLMHDETQGVVAC